MFTARPRGRRGHAVLIVIACLAVALLAPGGGPASADPIDDKKAEAARIADQLEQLHLDVELIAEDYNAATIRLAEIETGIAQRHARVAAAEVERAEKQRDVQAYAVEAYIRGGDAVTSPLLLQGDVSDFGQRSGYLSAAVDIRKDAIDQLRAAEEDAEAELEVLAGALAEAEETRGAIEQQRAGAEALVAQQQALHEQIQGEVAALVQAERERRAAEQAAAAAARRAARESTRPAAKAASKVPAAAEDTGPPPPLDGRAAVAVAAARSQIGDPYHWGGGGPDSFDCSGLTQFAWGEAGVSLPHNSQAQYNATRRISADQLEPGDLVFYGFSRIHHVAIYVGGGNIVHAPHAGDNVREDSIDYWDDVRGYGRV